MSKKIKGGLSPKQRELVDKVTEYIKRTGCSPTLREVRDMLGWKSHGAARQMLDRVVERGYLRTQRGVRRSILLAE